MNELIGVIKPEKKLKEIGLIKRPKTFSTTYFQIESDDEIYCKDGVSIICTGTLRFLSMQKETIGTDSENILKLYKHKGEQLIKYLDGFFLIVLYDKNKKSLLIFNNRYLPSSCYYYRDSKNVIFSTKIRLILHFLQKRISLDRIALNEFLNSGSMYSHRTLIENLFRIPPAHYLKWSNNKLSITKYWTMEFIRSTRINKQQKIDAYFNIAEKALLDIIQKNKTKQLGCLVSGGLDSSFSLACANRVFQKKIHTFNTYFNDPVYDEDIQAEEISRLFNTTHHKLLLDHEILNELPKIIWNLEEPTGDTTALNFYNLAQQSERYIDTILTGDGGDNIYGQLYPISQAHQYFRNLPSGIIKAISQAINLTSKISKNEKFHEAKKISSLFSKKMNREEFYFMLTSYRFFDDKIRKKLLTRNFFDNPEFKPEKRKETYFDFLVRMIMEKTVYYQFLPYTYASFDNKNIRLYSPFLEYNMINFINNLPQTALVHGSPFQKLFSKAVTKWFHRQALQKRLPKQYAMRAKKAFRNPINKWLREDPDMLDKLLKKLLARKYFNSNELKKIFIQFQKSKYKSKSAYANKNNCMRIFSLLNLETWHQIYFDQDAKPKAPRKLKEFLE